MNTNPVSVSQGLADLALHKIKDGASVAEQRDIADKYFDRIERSTHDENTRAFVGVVREVAQAAQTPETASLVVQRGLSMLATGVSASQVGGPAGIAIASFGDRLCNDIRCSLTDTTPDNDARAVDGRRVMNKVTYALEAHAPNDASKQIAQSLLSLQDTAVTNKGALNAHLTGLWIFSNVATREAPVADHWVGIFGAVALDPLRGSIQDRRAIGNAVLRHLLSHSPTLGVTVAARHGLEDANTLTDDKAVERQKAAFVTIHKATKTPPKA